MRTLLASVALMAILSGSATAEETRKGYAGYMHDTYHPYYQKLYNSGKCACLTGYCRPVNYRFDSESQSGVEVEVDGGWHDVPLEALKNQNEVPAELWGSTAHACAYPLPEGSMIIECAVINVGG